MERDRNILSIDSLLSEGSSNSSLQNNDKTSSILEIIKDQSQQIESSFDSINKQNKSSKSLTQYNRKFKSNKQLCYGSYSQFNYPNNLSSQKQKNSSAISLLQLTRKRIKYIRQNNFQKFLSNKNTINLKILDIQRSQTDLMLTTQKNEQDISNKYPTTNQVQKYKDLNRNCKQIQSNPIFSDLQLLTEVPYIKQSQLNRQNESDFIKNFKLNKEKSWKGKINSLQNGQSNKSDYSSIEEQDYHSSLTQQSKQTQNKLLLITFENQKKEKSIKILYQFIQYLKRKQFKNKSLKSKKEHNQALLKKQTLIPLQQTIQNEQQDSQHNSLNQLNHPKINYNISNRYHLEFSDDFEKQISPKQKYYNQIAFDLYQILNEYIQPDKVNQLEVSSLNSSDQYSVASSNSGLRFNKYWQSKNELQIKIFSKMNKRSAITIKMQQLQQMIDKLPYITPKQQKQFEEKYKQLESQLLSLKIQHLQLLKELKDLQHDQKKQQILASQINCLIFESSSE